jgi:hypothetical protein
MRTRVANKWGVPLLCVLLGLAFLGAFWIAGNPGAGLAPLAIMVAYGALLLLGGRSEVVRVLRGQPTDEMWRSFDVRATLFASTVLGTVMVGAAVVEFALGRDGQPYALLCLVFALAYVAALVWFRLRG